MAKISRNRLVMWNAAIILVTTVANVILGMYEMRLFIGKYGTTVNGLLQTGNQLMSYVSLLEAGIGVSYVYALYKPLAERDVDSISAVYSGFKLSMGRTVLRMFVFAMAVSLIYPLVIQGNRLNYWFMVSVFVLQSVKKILPYLFTIVPQNMIIVMEYRHIASLIAGISTLVTYVVEVALLQLTEIPLQGVLILAICVTIVTSLAYEVVMRRICKGLLKKDAQPDFTPNRMSRNVMVGNISALAFNSTDNIVISCFSSLSDVTLYSNYNTVSNQVTMLIQSIVNGATASFGIKLAKRDENTYYVFREIFTALLCTGGIITAVFIGMINEFIAIWFGTAFCMSRFVVVLFGMIMYCNLVFPFLTMMTGAAGLYRESRNFSIFQTILNLGLTLLLVPCIGIAGALIGTLVARIAVTIPKNYQLVYRHIFTNQKPKYHELIVAVFVCMVAVSVEFALFNFTPLRHINGLVGFFVRATIATVVATLINGTYYFFSNQELRKLIKRLFSVFVRR